MKFPLKKTIISILAAAILLAPVAPVFQKDKSDAAAVLPTQPILTLNTAEAQTSSDNELTLALKTVKISDTSASFEITANNTKTGYGDGLVYSLYDKSYDLSKARPKDVTQISRHSIDVKENTLTQTFTINLPGDGSKLNKKTQYFLIIQLGQINSSTGINIGLLGGTTNPFVTKTDLGASAMIQAKFTTASAADKNDGKLDSNISTSTGSVPTFSYTSDTYGNIYNASADTDVMGTCLGGGFTSGINFDMTNCIAWVAYDIWAVSAQIARLAGEILDFFVYYSTNSSSYSNTFVSKGWGAVRDVANIFFIIILLYIAVKTVLGLDAAHNKKLVAMVVVIALLINFSLFATQIVIDATNILAKVFYNNITPVNSKGGDATPPGEQGQKQISIGLVNGYNPQKIVNNDKHVYEGNRWTFILAAVILAAITLYTAWIFFVVAWLFVGRVVMLWIAMILSPLAFISFALPFNMPQMGHKDWSKNLLENAVLAPLFIFFLYLIVMFTSSLNSIINYQDSINLSSTENMFQHFMSVIIPFIILVGLLWTAKKLAVQYSGEVGKFLHKAASDVGKLAVGGAVAAATGGTALALRSSLGKIGTAVQNSQTLATHEKKGGIRGWGAARLRNIGGAASVSTFDARNIKIAGKSLPSRGHPFISKVREGGNVGAMKRKGEKRRKRAEELKTVGTKELQEKLHETEIDLQKLMKRNAEALAKVDKEIAVKKEALEAANRTYGGGTKEARAAGIELQKAKDKKKAIRRDPNNNMGYVRDSDGTFKLDANGNKIARTIEYMEKVEKPHLEHNIEWKKHEIAVDYAEMIKKRGGKTNHQTHHKIIMEEKLESGHS